MPVKFGQSKSTDINTKLGPKLNAIAENDNTKLKRSKHQPGKNVFAMPKFNPKPASFLTLSAVHETQTQL